MRTDGDRLCTECLTSNRLVTPATINLAMVRVRGNHSDNGDPMDVMEIVDYDEDVSLEEDGSNVTCQCDPDAYVARWDDGHWVYWDTDEQAYTVFDPVPSDEHGGA
jgi:hypothetical protein